MDENLCTTTPVSQPVSRRTPPSSSTSPSSNSWDSSSLSYNEEFQPFSPISPAKFKGIPFSWERIPGIPKQQGSKKLDPSAEHLLPLPPPAGSLSSSVKKWLHRDEISPNKSNRFSMDDPFLAALVECSKDDFVRRRRRHHHHHHANSSKIPKSLSDRFGLTSIYGSCKSTCAVSESIAYLPRQTLQHYLLNRRSG